MGLYLNRGNELFYRARNSEIYIDKSEIIEFLNHCIDTEDEYICISRPRRFGKSMTANMISAFYDRTCDAKKDFDGLKILSKSSDWEKYANKYDVIFINMQEFLSEASSINDMVSDIKKSVLWDLLEEYNDVKLMDRNNLLKCMKQIHYQTKRKFVVVIDEWDCIFREYREDKEAQRKYLDFLRLWFKDNLSISLVYMTGILPIKKYGTQSALNMFNEYSMENMGKFAEFTGFTEGDVEGLCNKFHMQIEDMKYWYDGYVLGNNVHIYNPRSIVSAINEHAYDDYWNKTETYEALKFYIDLNFDGLKDTILALMAGEKKALETGSYKNDMTSFSSADDVLTLLVHLGYLSYDRLKKCVFIPNNEILKEFVVATTAGNSWDEVVNSVKKSSDLLASTWALDSEKVAAGIEKAHLETSHIQYNDDNALLYTISLAYYAARHTR